MKLRQPCFLIAIVVSFLCPVSMSAALAQGSAFTYQGKLVENGILANGTYDLQFKLFDTAGTQQGSTVMVPNVTVTNGIFTVQLDFGVCASCFNGAERFLEVAVKMTGGGTFTTLSPRQAVTSTPYAIKSANATTATTATNATTADGLSATCVNCVTSNQIGSVNGNAVTGTIPVASVPAGSGNYIQNTTSQQASNFNISGNGIIGGNLGIGTSGTNFKLDVQGTQPGQFVSRIQSSTVIPFGASNGLLVQAGTSAADAAFLVLNQDGFTQLVVKGDGNVGVGTTSPNSRLDVQGTFEVDSENGITQMVVNGDGNVGIGTVVPDTKLVVEGTLGGQFVSRIQSSTVIPFGLSFGLLVRAGTSATDTALEVDNQDGGNTLLAVKGNGNVGVGTTSPNSRLEVQGTQANQFVSKIQSFTPFGASYGLLVRAGTGEFDTAFQVDDELSNMLLVVKGNGNVGVGMPTPVDKLHIAGDIRVGTGTTGCVKDADGTVISGVCSSDRRFKRNITPFANLLDKLTQLQPVHFFWRTDEFPDRHFGSSQSFGLVAQEVEKVMPELVTEDEQGYKAVNYSKLPILTLQAVKELKAENDTLKQKLNEQQNEITTLKKKVEQIETLKRIVCQAMPDADLCKPQPRSRLSPQ